MYTPSPKDKKIIKGVYDDYSEMRKLRNGKWPYFNDRTLKEYIDDNEYRTTGYVPTRAEQGKELWQANVFHPVTRNKLKAILASVALDLPMVRITAQNENSHKDATRANIMDALVKYSYNQQNKEEDLFFEAWEIASKGTVVVYDGYLRTKAKKKVIKSFDPVTGEIETEEEEVVTDDQCVNFIVPLMNFYVRDFKVYDVQKQPSPCWVEKMNIKEFEKEFKKYKNFDKVKTASELTVKGEMDTFFKTEWESRVTDDEPIEVIRYFNKGEDQFTILANGVVLLDSPLILGKKKKWYPFAKSVYEPFATDFFYGNSLPNTLMGEQDIINSLYNMALDRTYKSMMANLIIGNTNKDDFDLEDPNVGVDTRIYVQDINQVREMPIKGLAEGDIKMINLIGQGLDLTSVDSNQQGIQGRGVTAREVVIANENAKKLKGIIYMFLAALWIQKLNLRIMNILTFYTKPKVKTIVAEDGKENIIDEYQNYIVEGANLSDGSKGNMGIQMVGSEADLPKQEELDVQENMHRYRSGEEFEILAMTSDYLDDWQYDVKVVSESVYVTDSAITQAKMEDKLRIFTTYFPQFFQLNQDKLVKDVLTAYRDNIDDYDTMAAQQAGGGLTPETQQAQEMVQSQGQQRGKPAPLQNLGAVPATGQEAGIKPMPVQKG